jgi:hypothetical protein
MNASIQRRLEALEAKLARAPKPVTFWIHFTCPGTLDQPVVRIRHVDQVWHRLVGETEGAFRKPAETEAVLQPGCTGLVMLVD